MNIRHLCLSVAAVLSAMVAFGSSANAAEAVADKASAASGTHESRSAERKKNRAALKEANKKGELPKTTEAGEVKK